MILPTHAGPLLHVLAGFEADLPDAVADALQTHYAVQGCRPDAPDLIDAWIDAVKRGENPLTDPAVQVASVARDMHTGTSAYVQQETVRRLNQAIEDNTDRILELLRVPFDAAAADLVAAHETLQVDDLSSVTEILQLGGDAAATWGRAREAFGRIDQVFLAWKALARVTGGVAQRWSHFAVIAEVPLLEYVDKGYYDRSVGMDPWRAVVDGYPLRLAHPTEIRTHRGRASEAARARDQREADRVQKSRRPLAKGGRIKAI